MQWLLGWHSLPWLLNCYVRNRLQLVRRHHSLLSEDVCDRIRDSVQAIEPMKAELNSFLCHSCRSVCSKGIRVCIALTIGEEYSLNGLRHRSVDLDGPVDHLLLYFHWDWNLKGNEALSDFTRLGDKNRSNIPAQEWGPPFWSPSCGSWAPFPTQAVCKVCRVSSSWAEAYKSRRSRRTERRAQEERWKAPKDSSCSL